MFAVRFSQWSRLCLAFFFHSFVFRFYFMVNDVVYFILFNSLSCHSHPKWRIQRKSSSSVNLFWSDKKERRTEKKKTWIFVVIIEMSKMSNIQWKWICSFIAYGKREKERERGETIEKNLMVFNLIKSPVWAVDSNRKDLSNILSPICISFFSLLRLSLSPRIFSWRGIAKH